MLKREGTAPPLVGAEGGQDGKKSLAQLVHELHSLVPVELLASSEAAGPTDRLDALVEKNAEIETLLAEILLAVRNEAAVAADTSSSERTLLDDKMRYIGFLERLADLYVKELDRFGRAGEKDFEMHQLKTDESYELFKNLWEVPLIISRIIDRIYPSKEVGTARQSLDSQTTTNTSQADSTLDADIGKSIWMVSILARNTYGTVLLN